MEAEDILHDAFIHIFKTIGSFNNSGALGAWMRKVTVNKALENYRKNSRRIIHLNDYSNTQSTIEDTAIENLELDDLLNLIHKLSPGYRTIFNLYAIEGYNHREISEMLEISENTSKTQYSRARQVLRTMIEEEYERLNLNEIKINGIKF
jgi:RNA polymerase sigma factor (sigma-70 family)